MADFQRNFSQLQYEVADTVVKILLYNFWIFKAHTSKQKFMGIVYVYSNLLYWHVG